MWKNKHVVVAMLVAPVLAVLAWFAVDYFVAERPHSAEPGAAYPLVAKSNCRYDSGRCDLENADFEIALLPQRITPGAVSIRLESRFPLQQATLGLVEKGIAAPPVRMQADDEEKTAWLAQITAPASSDSMLRVGVVSDDATFFAEVPVVFLVE